MAEHLGNFEHLILLAIVRHGDVGFGLTIADEITLRTGRHVSIGAVYTTLDRLERKGLVDSVIEQGTTERDNRRRRRYRITKDGMQAIVDTQNAVSAMSKGLRLHARVR
jgi:PadR family transcriptional regulator PadR